MNITSSIFIIIIFYLISEFANYAITFYTQHRTKFLYIYVLAIRALIIMLACVSIKLAGKPNKFLQEADEFKYELIQHQDSVIQYQYKLIDKMDKHLEEEHNCDNPIFDGDDYYFIKEQQQIVDSLYNSQL